MNVNESLNDEKCPNAQKWTGKSHSVFKASKHQLDLKKEMKAFMINVLHCCILRLIG